MSNVSVTSTMSRPKVLQFADQRKFAMTKMKKTMRATITSPNVITASNSKIHAFRTRVRVTDVQEFIAFAFKKTSSIPHTTIEIVEVGAAMMNPTNTGSETLLVVALKNDS